MKSGEIFCQGVHRAKEIANIANVNFKMFTKRKKLAVREASRNPIRKEPRNRGSHSQTDGGTA